MCEDCAELLVEGNLLVLEENSDNSEELSVCNGEAVSNKEVFVTLSSESFLVGGEPSWDEVGKSINSLGLLCFLISLKSNWDELLDKVSNTLKR